MKRVIRLFCLLLALCSSVAVSAAGGKCGADLRWELSNSGTLTITGSGRMSDFGSNSTPWRQDLVKYIEVSDGITHIGSNAFSGSKIVAVSLPASLVGIGERAFYKCAGLASVDLPYGLESIERMAFADCGALSLINIPATTRSIGDRAFEGCIALSRITVPSRLRSLGTDAFKNCRSLTEIIELPEFVAVSNCARYGFNPEYVQDYLKRASAAETTVLASAASVAPKNYSQVFGFEGSTTEGYGSSDVDMNIPSRVQNNTNTFAVIISNENYGHMADVPFSINDGTSFAAYCRLVLGVPEANINFYKNASYGQMKSAIAFLRDIDDAYNGDINVIFYYSGHGAPDDASKEAFLIPVDAYKPVKDVCLPTDELYAALGRLKAKSVKVFLDACFSGATRDNGMIAQARAVAVVPKKSPLSGNTVVISASSDNQTSWQYNDQQHGLFTYYLLKKLKESKGDVSMGELSEYLTEKVGQMSVTINRKSQTPSAAASPAVGRIWRSWQLR